MAYQVLNVETAKPVNDPDTRKPFMFETGGEASAKAKELTLAAEGDKKYRVKRVLDDKWREREAEKFIKGTYQSLPWTTDSWWSSMRDIHRDHFPHVSREVPGMMAYTESEEKGMDNKQTKIRPGRYLAKFFDHYLSRSDIKELALRFGDLYEQRKVFFADTEDAVQLVYERGPKSCMSNRTHRRANGWGYPTPGEWPDGYHACRVYAAGDLQVAYLLEDQDNPKSGIIARCLVWPDKRTHSRVYGDETRLYAELKKLGYKFSPPEGARILRKPFERRFIVPYIDAGTRAGQGALHVKDTKDKSFLIICNDHRNFYQANSTNGLSSLLSCADGPEEDETYCSHCESEEVDEVHRVHYGHAGGDYNTWCSTCIEEDAFFDITDNRYYETSVNHIDLESGDMVTCRNFDRVGFRCPRTGHYLLRSQGVVLHGEGRVDRVWADENAFVSQWSGEWYMNDQRVEMQDGSAWAREEFASEGRECPSCHQNTSRYLTEHTVGNVCMNCHERAIRPTVEAAQVEQVLADGDLVQQENRRIQAELVAAMRRLEAND